MQILEGHGSVFSLPKARLVEAEEDQQPKRQAGWEE